jgi:UDP-glucose 4-epimerase
MLRVLVTGGAGFIGSNLVDELVSLGHNVTVIDNESSDSHNNFYWNNNAKNHKLDIRDYENTRTLYDGIDYVFHIAAESKIQSAINNPIEATSINVLGTATVLQCSKEAKVKRVIYSSTSSAYGRNTIPNVETQTDDCLNPYAVSKVAGEKLCSMYTELFELETIIFRYFNVYGERQPTNGQYAPVIGLFLKQNLEGKKMTIVGDGLQRRDFVNIKDVVKANILASFSNLPKSALGQVYNIGSGSSHSILDIVNMINPENYEFIPQRLGESKETLADINKAKSILRWRPEVYLKDYIGNNATL